MEQIIEFAALMVVFLFGHFMVLFGARVANDRRDAILCRAIGGIHINEDHRFAMFTNDWLPIKFSLAGMTLILAVSFFISARFVDATELKFICFICSGFSAFAFMCFLSLGAADFFLCQKSFRRGKQVT